MRRIGYAVLGNRDQQLASTRISVFNTLGKLRERGYQPEILDQGAVYSPDRDVSQLAQQAVSRRFSENDIVYFQSLRGESAITAANVLRRQRIRTVFGCATTSRLRRSKRATQQLCPRDGSKSSTPHICRPKSTSYTMASSFLTHANTRMLPQVADLAPCS